MNTPATLSLSAGLAAAAMVLLAGCSATHVGESWQCPLAQGTSCTSIAEADPAVPAAAARSAVLFGEPLHGDRRPVDGASSSGRRDRGEACDRECGPLAWLTGLFGSGTGNDPAALPPEAPATAAAEPPEPDSAITSDAFLRVPEVLGRIWIAPFVDQDGIYREAHWVRVVLEPAGWRLP